MTLPPASILGIGAVTPLGRDLQTIAQKLSQPAPPAKTFPVSDEFFSEPSIAKQMRRADRFTRMAVVAAMDAWKNPENIPMEKVGLIIATGFGPHVRGFRFLDGILDCGDSDALPTDFSHSVHGAAAAYITEILQLRGPSVTTTDFEIGFEQAILLAQCWLAQKTCDRVIVGAVEEIGEVMLHCASRMAPDLTPGEGAVFLTLAPSEVPGLARLSAASDLVTPEWTLVPHFGHSASGSAFQLLAALLFNSVDSPTTFKKLSGSKSMSLLITKSDEPSKSPV